MRPVNLHEYEALARDKLGQGTFDFIAGGSDDEVTLARNRVAFERVQLRPRVLVDVSTVDTSTSVLGQRLEFPVLLAPVAFQKLADTEGEMASGRAAAAAGTLMVLSTMATTRIEDLAETGCPRWFQLYMHPDRGVSERMVKRAEASGYGAVCLTADVPRLGRREADFRNRLRFPQGILAVNYLDDPDVPPEEQAKLASPATVPKDESFTWDDLAWLRSITSLPLLIKGILTAEDAVLAVEHGVQGIVVSNHGGRQLDTVPPAIDVLPEIAEAVGGRAELLLDSGVRRGTDVLKALALGARAVLIGRPYVFALAANGESGVAHALNLIRYEFELAMALAGVVSVGDIDSRLVRTGPG